MDWHCFHANPDPDQDPTFLSDADPDPDLDPDPTPSFTNIGKSGFFLLILFTAVPVSTVCQRHRCHNFQYFGQ